MIKGLYETHLYVENLEISIEFYTKVLGLKICRFDTERRTSPWRAFVTHALTYKRSSQTALYHVPNLT